MSKQTDQYIDNAVAALSEVEISLGRWDGVAKLKKGSAKAAQDVGANEKAARLYVNLLGSHHRKLKDVNAAYAAIRTYFYANTLPFTISTSGQQRGPRLLPVVRVPEVYGTLQKLAEKANTELEVFLKEYDRLREIAISSDMGSWRKELLQAQKYPSVDAVRNKFRCVIMPPRPLNRGNAEGIKNLGLPIGMAADFAAQHADLLEEQLANAKDAAVKQAEEQMAVVENQLRNGKRLHESLISNSARVARMLRDMVTGYNNDPRLLALADLIDKQIANVKSTEVWKTSQTTRDQSLEAATAVRKSLEAYAAGKPMGTISKPKASTKAARNPAKSSAARKKTGKVKTGGLIGKMQAKSKATKSQPVSK